MRLMVRPSCPTLMTRAAGQVAATSSALSAAALHACLPAGATTKTTGSGGAAGACRRFSAPCLWTR